MRPRAFPVESDEILPTGYEVPRPEVIVLENCGHPRYAFDEVGWGAQLGPAREHFRPQAATLRLEKLRLGSCLPRDLRQPLDDAFDYLLLRVSRTRSGENAVEAPARRRCLERRLVAAALQATDEAGCLRPGCAVGIGSEAKSMRIA